MSPHSGQARMRILPSSPHSAQSRPVWPWHSGQLMMRALPGGVMVAAIVVTSLGAGHYSGCLMPVSGFSFPFRRELQDRVGGGDGRFGRLDDGVPAPFGEDVPGFAEVDLVGFLGGDPDGPAFVYLCLPLAV